MKKVFTILIAALMLASGMRVTIDRHYCGGKLADTKISLTGKLASCGMETQEHSCSNQLLTNSKCCEDQLRYYGFGSKYFPEYFKLSHLLTGKSISTAPSLNPVLRSFDPYGYITQVMPPGDIPKPIVSLSQICVLRI